MIVGIGTDLIEIDRVKKACEKEAFFTRCFTKREQEAFREKPVSLAGNFAVKEAVSKLFGTGFTGFGPEHIEVLRDPAGKPTVALLGPAKELADALGIQRIFVSITNTKEYAMAVAVGEGGTP